MTHQTTTESRADANNAVTLESLKQTVDGRQAIALEAWLRQSQNGVIVPRRSTIRPEQIVEALPVSSLVAVEWGESGAPRFLPRIEGQMVTIAFGEARGRSFEQVYAPAHLEQVLPAFHEAAINGRVTLTPVATKTTTGEHFVYTRLLLPYTDGTGRVVRVLAVYGFDTERVRSLIEPLDIGDVIPTMNARRHVTGPIRLKTG